MFNLFFSLMVPKFPIFTGWSGSVSRVIIGWGLVDILESVWCGTLPKNKRIKITDPKTCQRESACSRERKNILEILRNKTGKMREIGYAWYVRTSKNKNFRGSGLHARLSVLMFSNFLGLLIFYSLIGLIFLNNDALLINNLQRLNYYRLLVIFRYLLIFIFKISFYSFWFIRSLWFRFQRLCLSCDYYVPP